MNIWQQIGNAAAMGGSRFTPLETFTGDAVIAVVNLYAFQTRENGPALCMEGLVVEATGNAPVGQMVSKAFFIARARYPEYEQADAKALAAAMLNTSDPQFIATECEKLTSNPAGQGARGTLVRAGMKPRADKKNTGKTFTDVVWAPVAGVTPEQIRQVRGQLEGGLVPPTALTLPDTTCVLSSAPVQAPPVQAWQQQPAAQVAPVQQAIPGGQPWTPPVQQQAAPVQAQPSILGGILGGGR